MITKTQSISKESSETTPYYYTSDEESLNILTHGFGCLMSVIGLILLISRAQELDDELTMITFIVFGISMIILYATSTIYHYVQTPKWRVRWAIADHAAIYLLTAGSYTPFTLITLPPPAGIWLFTAIWSCAAIGMFLKLFFTGQFGLISTIMYVLMGWMAILAINPLMDNLAINGVYLLFLGGISYTVGALFFMLDNKLKFNHAIFHIFVLGGSFCHFLAVYLYVIPK